MACSQDIDVRFVLSSIEQLHHVWDVAAETVGLITTDRASETAYARDVQDEGAGKFDAVLEVRADGDRRIYAYTFNEQNSLNHEVLYEGSVDPEHLTPAALRNWLALQAL